MKKLLFFTPQTFLETLAGIFINLTSGWFGILIVSPPLFKVTPTEYYELLKYNLPFAILSLVVTLWLAQKSKDL